MSDGEVDVAMGVVRQHYDALTISILAEDPVRTMTSSRRLHRAVQRARRVAEAADQAFITAFVIDRIVPMLAVARHVKGVGAYLGEDQRQRATEMLDRPHLVGLEATGVDMHETSWTMLHATHCALDETNLRASLIDQGLLESCNLARADLTESAWRRTRLIRCHMAAAILVDATLEEVWFEDCNLHGADLSVPKGQSAPVVRTTFVRCDLRETNWDARQLESVKFIDCKLYGVRGAVAVDRTEISGADVSPAGDGSAMVPSREILRRWAG